MLEALLRQLIPLFEPIGFVWLCLLGIAIALWIKRQRLLAGIASGLVVLITVIGSTGFPGWLLGTLEDPHAGTDLHALPPADAVVVLGGGIEPSQFEAGGVHFSKAGDRIIMALELMRLGKAPVLVIGGGGGELDGKPHSEADDVKAWLEAWKLPAAPVISLGMNRDTHDEALKVRALAAEWKWSRVLLVTSAYHMRRAAATFRTAGVDVVTVGCNFFTDVSTTAAPTRWHFPTYPGFEKVSIWLHEQIGWAVYRHRGWIAE